MNLLFNNTMATPRNTPVHGYDPPPTANGGSNNFQLDSPIFGSQLLSQLAFLEEQSTAREKQREALLGRMKRLEDKLSGNCEQEDGEEVCAALRYQFASEMDLMAGQLVSAAGRPKPGQELKQKASQAHNERKVFEETAKGLVSALGSLEAKQQKQTSSHPVLEQLEALAQAAPSREKNLQALGDKAQQTKPAPQATSNKQPPQRSAAAYAAALEQQFEMGIQSLENQVSIAKSSLPPPPTGPNREEEAARAELESVLKASNSTLETVNAKVAELQDKNDRLAVELKELKETKESGKRQHEEVRAAALVEVDETRKQSSAEGGKLRSRIAELEAAVESERNERKAKLVAVENEMKQQVLELDTEITEKENALKVEAEKLAVATEKVGAIEKSCQEARKQAEEWRQKHQAVLEKQGVADKAFVDAKNVKESLEKAQKELAKAIEAKSKLKKQHENEISKLNKSQQSAENDAVGKFKKALQEMEAKQKEKEEKAKRLTEQLERLEQSKQKRVDAKTAEVEEANKKASNAEQAVASARAAAHQKQVAFFLLVAVFVALLAVLVSKLFST